MKAPQEENRKLKIDGGQMRREPIVRVFRDPRAVRCITVLPDDQMQAEDVFAQIIDTVGGEWWCRTESNPNFASCEPTELRERIRQSFPHEDGMEGDETVFVATEGFLDLPPGFTKAAWLLLRRELRAEEGRVRVVILTDPDVLNTHIFPHAEVGEALLSRFTARWPGMRLESRPYRKLHLTLERLAGLPKEGG